MSRAQEEAAYIADHYGHCRLDICSCLRQNVKVWPGRHCPQWIPVEEMSFAARLEALRKLRR